MSHFEPIDNTFTITPTDLEQTQVECAIVTVSDQSEESGVSQTDDKFLSNFFFKNNLIKVNKTLLTETLCRNRDIFVTKENPDIGLTNVVEHQIHLKPDAEPKHQRPYRLPPDKKEVLCHQLDELLRQNIIAPVDKSENVPITSPIVLVSKPSKPKGKLTDLTKEQSLSHYRFCCDFRYLNSVTQEFRYNIPDLQELTES